MKKNLTTGVLALFMVAFILVSKAQAQPGQTDPVTVNIDLTAEVISIDLGADPTVDFVYAEAADYATEQVVNKPSHLTVVSNEPYNISVAAQDEFTSSSADLVDLGIVSVSVDAATANGGTLNTVPLSQTDGLLVENADATTASTFNVDYTISDATPLLNVAREMYTTTVIYTATQL